MFKYFPKIEIDPLVRCTAKESCYNKPTIQMIVPLTEMRANIHFCFNCFDEFRQEVSTKFLSLLFEGKKT